MSEPAEFEDEYDDDDFEEDDDEGVENLKDDDEEVEVDFNRIAGARSKALVEFVTRRIADDPDAIEVDVEEGKDRVTLLVHANPSDMGRLIGKRGRVIQALRRVVRASGVAEGVKANVDIAE